MYYALEKLSKKYEIIIYTASQPYYASAIVDYLDPEKKYIKYIISRDRCLVTKNGFFIKDLRLLKNRSLKNIVIIDDCSHSFCLQLDNGIPIIEYKGNSKDDELKYLVKYLLKCAETDDVREFNRTHLKLEELLKIPLSTVK